jgi:hypothetical protein
MFPIIITEPITYRQVEVPPGIVEYCAEFTQVDPYNKEDLSLNKLRLLDCYWYNMDYYRNMLVVPPGW